MPHEQDSSLQEAELVMSPEHIAESRRTAIRERAQILGIFMVGAAEASPAHAYDKSATRYVHESDALTAYIAANEKPLLTAPQEVVLIRAIRRGEEATRRLTACKDVSKEQQEDRAIARLGEAARDHFLRANMRLVSKIARKYQNHPIGRAYGLMDLFEEGYLGMSHALDKFELERGLKFSTYAVWWIRQAVVRAMHNTGTNIRVSVDVHEKFDKYAKLRDAQLEGEAIQEVMEIDDTMLRKLEDAYLALHPSGLLSLDEEVYASQYGRPETRGATIADARSEAEISEVINASSPPATSGQASILELALSKLDLILSDKENAVLQKLIHGETLSKQEATQRRKLADLFEHPAVRATLKSLFSESAQSSDWRDEAACIDHLDAFASSKRMPPPVQAKQILPVCAACAVRAECAAYVQESKPRRGRWVDGTNQQTKRQVDC